MKEDFFIPNFTQAPNYFFDELLQKLSSIEVHVLCAIIRKTYGWHKAEDQISFSQLTKATGLALSTVQKAIKKLVDKGIIVSKIIDGVRAYSFIVKKEQELTSKNSLPDDEQINSYIPQYGIDNVQNNSYIPQYGRGGLPQYGMGGIPQYGNTKETPLKKESKTKGPLADFFMEKISFNFETKKFENVEELDRFVAKEYLERIRHFGLDAQKIYDDACDTIFQRKGTPLEVKKPGKWLLSIFKDASYGNVFKFGATNEIEENNFLINYDLWCSWPDYKEFQVSGKFLCANKKEFSFYSSPEIFKKVLEDYALQRNYF